MCIKSNYIYIARVCARELSIIMISGHVLCLLEGRYRWCAWRIYTWANFNIKQAQPRLLPLCVPPSVGVLIARHVRPFKSDYVSEIFLSLYLSHPMPRARPHFTWRVAAYFIIKQNTKKNLFYKIFYFF